MAKIDATDLGKPPTAHVIPGINRDAALVRTSSVNNPNNDGTQQVEQGILNACSAEMLVEHLRYLKRSYVGDFVDCCSW